MAQPQQARLSGLPQEWLMERVSLIISPGPVTGTLGTITIVNASVESFALHVVNVATNWEFIGIEGWPFKAKKATAGISDHFLFTFSHFRYSDFGQI